MTSLTKHKRWGLHAGMFSLTVGALWLMGSGGIQSAYNLIENAGTPLTKRQILNFTGSGVSCSDASPNTTCNIPGGGSGSGGTGGLTVFSGSSVTLLGTQYVAIGGGAAISSTEASVQIESPTAAQVSNLSVQISAALGVSASAVFTWRDGGSGEAVTCTISGASQTTCQDNTHSFNVAQGDEIDIQIVTTGTPSAATIVIASQFGTLSGLNSTFTISNASSTGTTINTPTKLTGAPSTAVSTATSDTTNGVVVGICQAGCGTTGTATIQTSGLIGCAFDSGGSTAGDFVQNSTVSAASCTDAGSTFPTAGGTVLGHVLSTNSGSGTYIIVLELQPAASSGGGGSYIQPLTPPVAANFTQTNYNTGTDVVTTQTNFTSPVTGITLNQSDPAHTFESAALVKSKINALFTFTIGYSFFGTSAGDYFALVLDDGTAGPNILAFNYQLGLGLRGYLFNNYANSSASEFMGGPYILWPAPAGGLMWQRVQETSTNRIYSISSDGQNFYQFFIESNTAHFTTAHYGWALANGSNFNGQASNSTMTVYSVTETTP
jgi:hypothetical protein